MEASSCAAFSGSVDPKTLVITAIPSTPVCNIREALSLVIPPIAKTGISVMSLTASSRISIDVGSLSGFVGV